MPLALLQSKLSHSAIDAENGVISGVMVMKLGKLAQFEGEGKVAKRVKITQAHIDALLSHAGNRAIPMHQTHDWFASQGTPTADTVEMQSRIGALKCLRKDGEGNLIADAYLKSGQTREDILWGAEHNPEDNMLSAVFSYAKNDPLCLPCDFRACDLVPSGAATTALFSSFNQNDTNMDKTALLEMLKDDEVKTALLALIPKTETNEVALLKSAEDKADALFTAKKAEILAEAKAEAAKDFEANKVALLKEAEASVVKNIGQGGFLKDFGKKDADDAEAFITAQLSAGCKDRGQAIARMANDKPELYNTARAAGKI